MKGKKWIYVHTDLQQPATKEWCVATAWDKIYDNSDMHRRYKLLRPIIMNILFNSARVLNPNEMTWRSEVTLQKTLWLSHRSGWQPKTYVKPEAAITIFELLMMGGVSPETC